MNYDLRQKKIFFAMATLPTLPVRPFPRGHLTINKRNFSILWQYWTKNNVQFGFQSRPRLSLDQKYIVRHFT